VSDAHQQLNVIAFDDHLEAQELLLTDLDARACG